ncbi:MAG: hypothetical protein ACFE8P_09180, partial [Promethearchaeota archaeon]
MFREINQVETNIINKSLLDLSPTIFQTLERIDYSMWIKLTESRSYNYFPRIYLVPNRLKLFIKDFNQATNIMHSGIYFGRIKQGNFYLSLEGAEFMHQFECFSKNQIIKVNDMGEKAILYGNKVKKEYVEKTRSGIAVGSFILIFNKSNDLLAIGRSQVKEADFQALDDSNIIIIIYV